MSLKEGSPTDCIAGEARRQCTGVEVIPLTRLSLGVGVGASIFAVFPPPSLLPGMKCEVPLSRKLFDQQKRP